MVLLKSSVLLLAFAALALCADAQEQLPRIVAAEFVRQAVTNELKAANAPGHYMYRLHKQTARGSETKAMIETKDWLIGRTVQVNGKLVPPAQRQKEEQRLARLLGDPEQLRKEEHEQRKEEERVRNMVKALPDAFLYDYAGAAKNSETDGLARLTFQPYPAFRPPSRELSVLSGMKGSMLIDPTAKRLVLVDAKLFRDVSFGWGILARLNEGGSFLLEEGRVGSGRWAIKTLALHFTGKVLLFKNLVIESVMMTSDFRRMRDDLTLQEGLELLRRQDMMESGGEGGKRSQTKPDCFEATSRIARGNCIGGPR